MKLMRWLALGWFLVCGCRFASAQNTEAELASHLVNKPLILLGLWRDDKLEFDASGQPAHRYHTASFTVSGVEVQRVGLHGKHLRLEGFREGIVFDRDGNPTRKPLLTGSHFDDLHPEKLTIDIDGGGSKDFQPALKAIFASNIGQIAPAAPDFWQDFIAGHFDAGGNPLPQDKRPPKGTSFTAARVGKGVTPPKLLHSAEPEFDEEARRQKFSGNVTVRLVVDTDGNPTHLSVARPVGMGLDEKAIEAVRQYRFNPAMRDGQPVAVELYIDVNFQIF